VINQIKAMLVSRPDSVREKYSQSTTLSPVEALDRRMCGVAPAPASSGKYRDWLEAA
jgi:hypothetical protein